MGLGIALRAFTASLFNRDVAERLRLALEDIKHNGVEALPSPAGDDSAPRADTIPDKAAATPTQTKTRRSDAVTLLSTLQRESRFVDLVQENLSAFSDEQVGAAARPCLQSCHATLQRLFDLRPVDPNPEGTPVEVSPRQSSRYQWIGESDGGGGSLVHHGWAVGHVELPRWTGDDADADLVAAAQVQSRSGS